MRRPHEQLPRLASGLALLACLAVLARSRVAGAGGMPATFIFGDSLVDAGNNNYIVSLSKANFPPNGIDFLGHQPTGRYTNGRTIVDILGAMRTQSLCLIFGVARALHWALLARMHPELLHPPFPSFGPCFRARDGTGRVRAAVHGPGDHGRRRDERRQLRVRRRRDPQRNRQYLRQYTAFHWNCCVKSSC